MKHGDRGWKRKVIPRGRFILSKHNKTKRSTHLALSIGNDVLTGLGSSPLPPIIVLDNNNKKKKKNQKDQRRRKQNEKTTECRMKEKKEEGKEALLGLPLLQSS